MTTRHKQFVKTYAETSNEIKLSFLTHLLHANKERQKLFMKFITQEKKENPIPSLKDFAKAVAQCQQEIAAQLQQVDLKYPNWDDYTPSHSGYMKDWESHEDASQQEVKAVIDHYLAIATDHLTGQELAPMYSTLFGLFMACRETYMEDPIPCFNSVNEYLTDTLEYTLHGVTEKIDYAILPEVRTNQVMSLILKYCLEHRKDDAGFLRALQPPIHAMVRKIDNTKGLLSSFENSKKIGVIFPRVYLAILWGSGHKKKWLTRAKQSYRHDLEIAKNLLQFYHDEKMQGDFVPLARQLFSSDEQYWANFLQPFVNLEINKSLYLDVHLQLIRLNTDIEMYQKIRPALNQKQINNLIDKIWNNTFLVEILTLEKRYDDIKKLVEDNYRSYNFAEIITPILDIYPDYCFETLKRLVYDQLENERGRSAYRRIVQKLILTRQIKGLEEAADKLIREVYDYNNRLSALRDEMRQSELIKHSY